MIADVIKSKGAIVTGGVFFLRCVRQRARSLEVIIMLEKDLVLNNVSKRYGDKLVVNSVYLKIEKGDFLTILGPSGGGKTTVLKMISGFESITEGNVYMDGENINMIPAHKRNFGMLFQNYALFPHMTVEENVAYPLKIRKVPKEKRNEMVKDILNVVGLGDFGKRYPRQLSGGQQQRVALARSIVFSPDVLLLDEPLAALDKQLRKQMQLEIKAIHDKFGLTTISVTHDQEEALTMATKVCVMKEARVQQVDTPEVIYDQPVNTFVANFIGESTVLPATIKDIRNGKIEAVLEKDDRTFAVDCKRRDYWACIGQKVNFIIRPEKVKIVDESYDGLKFHATITTSVYLGDTFRINVVTDHGIEFKMKVFSRGKYDLSVGNRLCVGIRPYDLVLVRDDD